MVQKRQQEYVQYLSAAERELLLAYNQMSDEEIYQMIRDVTAELGHPPTKADIEGAGFLKNRFGPWPRLLEVAGVKPISPTKQRRMEVRKMKRLNEIDEV